MAFAAAHRGLSSEHPENTLHAFEQAIEAGFKCLEMDLRMTHDDKVVVLHDAGIDRTTDGNGRVRDFTYRELKQYNTGEGPIPLLDDLMDQLEKHPVFWNLEVKAGGAVEPTIELVEKHGLEKRALVSAMNPDDLEEAKKRHPGVPRGLIVLGPPDEEDLEAAKDAGCSWINIDDSFATPEIMNQIRAAGFKIGVWTVNDAERAVELQKLGADCIITDQRDVLVALGEATAVNW